MITLKNGRGQVGEKLKELIDDIPYEIEENIEIYHTWNIEDKSEDVQSKELEKFIKYVNTVDENTIIVFISTYMNQYNDYWKYKTIAESFLMEMTNNFIILRLPLIIGKGTCQKFKENTISPYGKMEIITLERACEIIIDESINSITPKVKRIEGSMVNAQLIYDLIQFGKRK